uniref:BTB domain-containing protein n=1 Tax=Strix occidentalis caurina TaxID=311401 RepID=A0A8D0EK44_STROC
MSCVVLERQDKAWRSTFHCLGQVMEMACASFSDLCLEGTVCDVTISMDGVESEAHKIVPCSCSDYFRSVALFNAEKTVYKIPGTSPNTMRLIIAYAYTGTAPVTADSVEALLITAERFNDTGVIGLCCEFLQSQLCLENCISIWRLTGCYRCPALRDAADAFILRHFAEVTRGSAELLDLSIPGLRLLVERAERGRTRAEAVERWVAHDPPSRWQPLSPLVPLVATAAILTAHSLSFLLKSPWGNTGKTQR